ncbi:ATP-dependent zinc metalloprotease FtsH [Sediminicurvatus halobius]|uniref:ATP-dependent zinc metalloprotease FtsH n=1 Tax=Sediminicurvatus halobius TaxID=2182432 RepID=UPI003FA34467
MSPWYTFIWLSVLILVLSTWTQGEQAPGVREIPYSEFRAAVVDGEVREVTLRGNRLRGEFTDAAAERRGGAEATPRFYTIVPAQEDRTLLRLLEAHQVTVRAEPTEGPWWQQLLLGVVPWILLLAVFFWLWFYAQRRMMAQGGPGGLFGFGRSRARRFREKTPSVTMDQVAGVENAKRDLMEIVEFLRDPGRFRALGAKIPRGVLMVGPPGTGKTLIARAVAGEAGVTFFSISGSEFIEMFVGVGASRVRDLFQNARKEAPALIFIDELDAIGRSRGTGLGGGHDEREQTLNQILTEMDGFEGHEDVIVLAATNRPDVLDPALLRPGRFDRKVVLDRPHRDARRQILAVHTRQVPLADDVDLDRIAARTIGFAGADLANLVNEAALLAARRGLEKVDADCFEAARDRIVLGERREVSLDEEERRVVAYHECGHALAAWLLPHTDPLEKVTVIPHGQALGVTEQLPDEERYNFRESYLRDRIKVMLGGRAAERVVFDEVSSGAENDLRQATRLVRNMVAKWGMSERLGPLGLNIGDEHVFLGREMAQPRDHSERLAELIDDEVRSLLRELEQETEELLRTHRAALDGLAEAVLERETLDADDVKALLEPKAGRSSAAAERG